jgi:hypothetical protein
MVFSQYKNKGLNGMRKRGRPPAKVETVQVAVRLPREWVEQFRKEGGVTKAIQKRLFDSALLDDVDPEFRKLWAQIEQLAKWVRRLYGCEWYEDQNAHKAFVDTVKRLVMHLPEPAASTVDIGHAPEVAAEFIYRAYVAELQEAERGEHRMEFKTLLGGSDD